MRSECVAKKMERNLFAHFAKPCYSTYSWRAKSKSRYTGFSTAGLRQKGNR